MDAEKFLIGRSVESNSVRHWIYETKFLELSLIKKKYYNFYFIFRIFLEDTFCNFKNLEILNLNTTLTMATLYLFQLNVDFLETKPFPLPMAGRNGFMSNSWERETRLCFLSRPKIYVELPFALLWGM